MNRNLLIIGAGIYGVVAYEIAESMECFDEIGFVDDVKMETPNGLKVVGTVKDLPSLACKYNNIAVAIGDPAVRLDLLSKIHEEIPCKIVNLISPKAYISPSAQISEGVIIEPMAVVHTGCILNRGCIISAGAVLNHLSFCAEGVHIDCNATLTAKAFVPARTKVENGSVYGNSIHDTSELFFDK